MHAHDPSERFLRIHTVFLFFMGLFVFLGPVLDWIHGVQTFLGRINNMTAVIVGLYLLLSLALPPMMRARSERLVMAGIAAGLLYATLITLEHHHDWITSFGGLLAMYGAASAGIGAYVLARAGMGLQQRLTWMLALTLPALAMPVAMIAHDPDAFRTFWLKVYGFGNVRVMGEFAAAVTVTLAGLCLVALQRKSASFILLALLALSIAWSLLFWSGSRASMLASLIGILAGIALTRSHRASMLGLNAGGIAFGAGLSLLYYTPPGVWFGLFNRISTTVRESSAGATLAESADRATSGRVDLWFWVIERIMDKPLTGHGYLPMAGIRTPAFNYYHSHNVLLEYLLGFGLIAGSLMLLLVLGLWVRALLRARELTDAYAAPFVMLAIMLPIHGLNSAILFFPYHLIVFALVLGTLIGWRTIATEPAQKRFSAKADWIFSEG